MNRILPNKKLNVKKIIEKLESMGLSQSKLASELSISRQVVSKWMKNEKFPRPEKLLKLAHRLKLSFDEIVVKLPSEGEPVIAFRKKGRALFWKTLYLICPLITYPDLLH